MQKQEKNGRSIRFQTNRSTSVNVSPPYFLLQHISAGPQSSSNPSCQLFPPCICTINKVSIFKMVNGSKYVEDALQAPKKKKRMHKKCIGNQWFSNLKPHRNWTIHLQSRGKNTSTFKAHRSPTLPPYQVTAGMWGIWYINQKKASQQNGGCIHIHASNKKTSVMQQKGPNRTRSYMPWPYIRKHTYSRTTLFTRHNDKQNGWQECHSKEPTRRQKMARWLVA